MADLLCEECIHTSERCDGEDRKALGSEGEEGGEDGGGHSMGRDHADEACRLIERQMEAWYA